MAFEYANDLRLRHRVLLLAAVPLVVLVGAVIMSVFGILSVEARDLVASVFRGDMTRLGDFLGLVVIVILCFGGAGTIAIAALRTALLEPDQVVKIDPDRRVVTVDLSLPWMKSRSLTYGFDEIEAVELEYDGEQSKILLHLPDRRRPLTLTYTYRLREAEGTFRRLVEIGLPSK